MQTDVIGAGAMGKGMAALLRDAFPHWTVRLIDRDMSALTAAREAWKCEILCTDQPQQAELAPVVICAASWPVTLGVIESLASRATRGLLVSISRPAAEDVPRVQQALIQAPSLATVLPCGLEPGLTEILAGYLLESTEQVQSLRICCGGIVVPRPANPLGYKRLFGTSHLPLAKRDAYCIRDGALCVVPRFSDVQQLAWPGIGVLEHWHDGMQPRLSEHPKLSRPGVDADQRTLRWTRYVELVALLDQLGVLAEDAVDENTGLTPKQLFERATQRTFGLAENEQTKTLLAIELAGSLHGRRSVQGLRLTFTDRVDVRAMALATCLPVVFLVNWLTGAGKAVGGFHYPETIITPQIAPVMLDWLARRGVEITMDRYDDDAEEGTAGLGGREPDSVPSPL
ncbi:saccharopine dehydrogenase C-terminal domain-containing protein [Bradyrhizobium yuanmingense]|uniref:saccharopine dehydrogenase C-terminal domain-containing protein n=1 Tax=Bradyrhizobium yuanmingense TaxID=108015 RepID=UPI0023B9A43E|nr:saccharopine dehydrogenase C-terminal domain-containing protein [Bradyrhizobium yuanmingense]MDF0522870.1 saccharopine dehydrogenase C-terminal domain-containing protein [Bradyrhizobium yuanmingense]